MTQPEADKKPTENKSKVGAASSIIPDSDWLDELFVKYHLNGIGQGGLTSAAVKAAILKHIEETEKAFGGCKLCYGKGYATVNEKWVAHDTDQDIGSPGGYFKGGKDFAIKYCTCDRGQQLERLSEESNREARIDELEWLIPNGPAKLGGDIRGEDAEVYTIAFKEACDSWKKFVKNRLAELKDTAR